MIDLAVSYQRIEGFGASSAWTTPRMTDPQAEMFFSVDQGLGLTLLRAHINPDGTTGELVTAQKAAALGVKVWAAPWSPPAEWKDNDKVTDGGVLRPEHYQEWADRLAAFAKSMAEQGAPLVALSAQNEPGYMATWESCIWTPAQLTTFVRDNLGPTLAREGLTLPIIAPEAENWGAFDDFANALVADPAASSFVGPLATHAYGNAGAHAFSDRGEHPVWMTEVSASGPLDPGMNSGLWAAHKIHENLVDGSVNAFHWWWMTPGSKNDGSGLTEGGQLTRRAWVLANWSRFVRPGFVRVKVPPRPQPNLYVSAFTDPDTGRLVVVVVNESEDPLTQAFTVTGRTIGPTLTPWITSDDFVLAAQEPIAVTADGISYTFPARSVTSLVTD